MNKKAEFIKTLVEKTKDGTIVWEWYRKDEYLNDVYMGVIDNEIEYYFEDSPFYGRLSLGKGHVITGIRLRKLQKSINEMKYVQLLRNVE